MLKTNKIMKLIFLPILLFFLFFLIVPLLYMFWQSFKIGNVVTTQNYIEALRNIEIREAFTNSFKVSFVASVITTILAFWLAYAVHFTTMHRHTKKLVQIGITLPMLLPTITYGFVLIYTFGNQGILTKLVGQPLFTIYGYNGLVIGYVLYTLPVAFILMQNSMQYIDKRFLLVSILMHDQPMRRFYHTVYRPMVGTIGGAFILTFVLSFTDFGIPASVGGNYRVIATELYQAMLGSIVHFERGAVISVLMLVPAVLGVVMLTILERFNFQYKQVGQSELVKHRLRDTLFTIYSILCVTAVCIIFLTMFIVPFTKGYPYDFSFTLEHVQNVLAEKDLTKVYINSLIVAVLTAILGVGITFMSALLNTRTPLKGRKSLDVTSMMTNTVPGMVLGLSYLFFFNGSSLKGTFLIVIACNIVHFFTTPYLMAKNSLQKMDPTWEVTAELLKDSWLKTVIRIILPNIRPTIYQMFSYYFLNAMVTVSGVIFLVSTKTMLVSTRIKELQHFAKYTDIFVLSIFILCTNLIVKLGCDYIAAHKEKTEEITK
ncbi:MULTISPECIES: ABC transporter permease subunit [Lysinibacillus]|uniref:ABC transporter permease subunit n=1 Tax=Lysinibacillus TaxID=400634 RepID=UPI000653C348|nr:MULTISPECIES: ABC transporter permease subunit [Lysinibacillus]KMN40376.1 iron ABC transporter permease [Lysinibacillus sp. LK3]MCR6523363.1 ABC transporter permease subunit [Lysinibacillus capsici]MCT1540934.1 ABC transporter permease subunit [Lysinibacillus capsici]MCT1572304.1 ABC transporter permease subunit [Lysinibacillus capsici]MCT1649469.1 ABC transporter permease subunit [Lysinibacillus capsici]